MLSVHVCADPGAPDCPPDLQTAISGWRGQTVTNRPLLLFLLLPLSSCFFSSLFPFFALHPGHYSLSSLLAWPAHPLHGFLPPVFALSSTRLPSCLCSYSFLSRLSFCVVISARPVFSLRCLWHLPVRTLTPDVFSPLLISFTLSYSFFCSPCGSSFYLSCFLSSLNALLSYFSLTFFPTSCLCHLFSLCRSFPSFCASLILSLLLLVSTSSYCPFSPLFHHLLIFLDSSARCRCLSFFTLSVTSPPFPASLSSSSSSFFPVASWCRMECSILVM